MSVWGLKIREGPLLASLGLGGRYSGGHHESMRVALKPIPRPTDCRSKSPRLFFRIIDKQKDFTQTVVAGVPVHG
jgi:hypothetical protein